MKKIPNTVVRPTFYTRTKVPNLIMDKVDKDVSGRNALSLVEGFDEARQISHHKSLFNNPRGLGFSNGV
jgi:hypothetical protein